MNDPERMLTSLNPSCERSTDGCGYCVALTRQAIEGTLKDLGTLPSTAQNIAQHVPEDVIRAELGPICEKNQLNSVISGQEYADQWFETSSKKFETVRGKEIISNPIDIQPLLELFADADRLEYFRRLTSSDKPLTRGRYLEAARQEQDDIKASVLAQMNEFGWPSEEDSRHFGWPSRFRFVRGEKANFEFGTFISGGDSDTASPNNLLDRLRDSSLNSKQGYVERAKLLAPDLYEALKASLVNVDGNGVEEIRYFLTNARGHETTVFLTAYRQLYVLFARLMRTEDIRSNQKDVLSELTG